jgi:arylsulfatase
VGGADANGPVLVQGDHFGGQALLLDQGRPLYVYNPGESSHVVKLEAPEPLTAGPHAVTVEFTPGERAPGAVIDLKVDGRSVARTETSFPVRSRGDAYVGRPGVAPILDGPEQPTIGAACSCSIQYVKVERTAGAR